MSHLIFICQLFSDKHALVTESKLHRVLPSCACPFRGQKAEGCRNSHSDRRPGGQLSIERIRGAILCTWQVHLVWEKKRAGAQTEQMASQTVLATAEISEYRRLKTESPSLASLSIKDRGPPGQVLGKRLGR